MKTFRLLIAALSLATAASAQNYDVTARNGEYAPVVYMVSVEEDIAAQTPCCRCNGQSSLYSLSAAGAKQDYADTWRTGFQQVEQPTFIFASKNNRFSLALGGYINLRMGYDFDGTVDNIDFIPADIPMVRDYSDRQNFMMDATTSRLYLKAIANTRKLGRVIVFVDADFRGGREHSYTPRIRSAYVSMLGFTLGRDVTTFCDLDAAPTTVDFQGPNAYNFRFATMLRYEISFANDHLTFGAAAEMPSVSAAYNDKYRPLSQRMPDFPMYLQVSWGRNRLSHLRASAVLRNMYMRNTVSDKDMSLFGWGVQASGRINLGRVLGICFNGVYGKGITPYIQDLEGMALDFTPNPSNPNQIQTTPMWGWQAAAQINIVPGKCFVSGGYSMVRVEEHNGYVSTDEYRQGQYIFGNIFYHVTPRFKIAGEYLYGSRKDMSGMKNHANRVNIMAQYSF